MSTKLPKLYRPVWIKFSALRNQLGENYGVVHDCDVDVIRKCRRVLTGCGWKWQICGNIWAMSEWDFYVISDQLILDEHDESIEFTIVDRPLDWMGDYA